MSKIWNDQETKDGERIGEDTSEYHYDVVYYDGACPLCSREICNIRTISQSVKFVDIHSSTDLPRPKPELLKTLHYFRKNGEILKGLDANIEMWRHGRHPWLSGFFSLPLIYTVAGLIYNIWSDRRYNKRYG